jgi:hypothetical protein
MVLKPQTMYFPSMEQVAAFLGSLNTGHWIAIVAIIVGSFFGSFTVANYLAARRDRELKIYETTPEVKATINRTRYKGGWRSVQLHITAPSGQQNFTLTNWYIKRARLVRPWRALLARAENDDYAIGVFYPNNPIRVLAGKTEGRLQRFALEFFMKFKDKDDKGKDAKFSVKLCHINERRRHTVRAWATVPADAE